MASWTSKGTSLTLTDDTGHTLTFDSPGVSLHFAITAVRHCEWLRRLLVRPRPTAHQRNQVRKRRRGWR